MRVLVIGATGRTGSEVLLEAGRRGHDVVGVASEPGEQDDVRIHGPDAIEDVLVATGEDAVDVAIDFSVPEATLAHAPRVADAGVPYVVGTTGFDADDREALDAVGADVPLLKATNFARGVQTLLRLVEAGVAALPEYDVELTETHHAGKRDAPSGTAATILDVVDDARETALDRVHGREGEHRRESTEVGVHVRRAGTVRGEHELLLAGNDEVLTLTHRAESRRVFAAGALDAAEWLTGQPPGHYEFADVL